MWNCLHRFRPETPTMLHDSFHWVLLGPFVRLTLPALPILIAMCAAADIQTDEITRDVRNNASISFRFYQILRREKFMSFILLSVPLLQYSNPYLQQMQSHTSIIRSETVLQFILLSASLSPNIMSVNMSLYETRTLNKYICVTATNTRAQLLKLLSIASYELPTWVIFRVFTDFRNNDFLDVDVEPNKMCTYTHTYTVLR